MSNKPDPKLSDDPWLALRRNNLTRRDFIKLGSMIASGLALSPFLQSCAPAATATPEAATSTPIPEPEGLTGSIETWSPDTRDDAIASEKWWIEAFESANPGATINQLTVPYGEDTAKLKAAHESDTAPDIIWAYTDLLYSYGLDGLAQSTNDLMEGVGLNRFPQGVLDSIRVNGTYYTVPFVGFPFMIYYRKDLYEQNGLQPPKTHEEFLENVKALNDPPDTYGYMLTNGSASDTFNLWTAMFTHGAYFFDENDQLALDRPETIAAWTFYKELGKYSPPGSMAQSDLESRALMIDGKVAHMFTTTSFAANFKEEDIARQGAFLYPVAPGGKGASLDFYGFCIPTKAKNPDLAKEVIKYWLTPEVFEGYLIGTVVGWVPMLDDAWTEGYLSDPRIAPVREYFEIGQESAKAGIVGSGYFGPSMNSPALVATDASKQIGDRLVVLDQSPEEVLEWAIETIQAAL